jgi:hypothetical protein
MDQLFKYFENTHHPNLKEYVSQFGNIDGFGHLTRYCKGVHSEHWRRISVEEFEATASPEALILIQFINFHKRLPNWFGIINRYPGK